jgi:hypothetical protein
MKQVLFQLVFVILFLIPVSAQKRDSLNLEAKLTTVKKVYCEDFTLGLIFRLTYKNTGNTNLIISKSAPLPGFSLINKILADGTELKFSKIHSFISYGNSNFTENFPDPKKFVTLQPNETLAIENITFGTSFYEPKYRAGLKEGKYILKHTLLTFPYLVDEKVLSLEEYKHLWTKSVTIPVTFQVDSRETQIRELQSREDCQKLNDSPQIKYIISAEGAKNTIK